MNHPFVRTTARLSGCIAIATLAAAACSKEARDVLPRGQQPPDSAAASSAAADSSIGATSAPSGGSYVGVAYSSPPAGVKSIGGATLSGPDGGAGNYAFNHVTTPRGEMIWLDTVAAARRVVIAELPLPPLARDERLMIGSCDVRGRLDPRTIAIVIADSGATRFTKVRQAWRVDLHAARFDLIPVAGVVCEDPDA